MATCVLVYHASAISPSQKNAHPRGQNKMKGSTIRFNYEGGRDRQKGREQGRNGKLCKYIFQRP